MAIDTHSHAWRVILSDHSTGARNMAADEALLTLFDPLHSLPILRIYGWNPAALSIGRFQNPLHEINLEKCRSDGVCLVRRITGGGAIFHAHELTYSLVCSPEIVPASSVKDSFRILTAFLIDFYRRLGLSASYAADASEISAQLGLRTAYCFAGRESYDILVQGKKIGGNAQRRLKNVIFQHGSIPISSNVDVGLSYMKGNPIDQDLKVTSLNECGVGQDIDMLTRYLLESFRHCFSVNLIPDSLTPAECELAEQLSAAKYLNNCWNIEGSAS